MDFSLEKVVDILAKELKGWLETGIENIPNAIIAILVLVIGYIIANYAKRGSRRVFSRLFDSDVLAGLFSTGVKVLIFLLILFFALDLIGLKKAVVSLLAGAGIIGLALGFAFQDLAENLLAGLMLAIRKPFKIGDLVKSNDIYGTVKELNLRNTIIEGFDGQTVYIPNKDVFKNVLKNFSKTGKRRITISVGVSYGEDLDHVEKILRKTVEQFDFTSSDKEPDIWALEYGGSSINFSIRYWIDYPGGEASYLKAIHLGVKAIKKAFDKEDILIPFPIRTLDFDIKGGMNLAEPLKKALSAKVENEKTNH